MTAKTVAMALHGGAGAKRGRDYGREIAHMRTLIEAGRERLRAGAPALDVAVETVAALSHYPRILTHQDARDAGVPEQFLTAELPHGYRIWSSLDGERWDLCREGIFRVYGGEETVRFPETQARYIRLEITSSCGVACERGDFRGAHISMAELTLWKKA